MNIGGDINHNIDIADEDMAALTNIAWGIALAFMFYTAAFISVNLNETIY